MKLRQGKGSIPDSLFFEQWISKVFIEMGDALIATNVSGQVVAMNEIAEKLTGYTLQKSADKSIEEIFYAIDESSSRRIDNPVYMAIREDKNILLSNHTILVKSDNSRRIIVDSAIPIHNPKNEIIGCALVFRDVTQLAESKQKLKETEDLLLGIMENTNLLINIKDIKGKYLFMNRQSELIFKHRNFNLRGKTAVVSNLMKQKSNAKETEKFVMDYKNTNADEEIIEQTDGTKQVYHTSRFPLFNKYDNVYAICSVSSVQQRNASELESNRNILLQDTINESLQQINTLTENIPELYFSFDKKFRFTAFNNKCEALTGKKAGEVLNRTMEEAFPDGNAIYFDEFNEVMISGKAKSFNAEFSFADNKYFFLVNIYPTNEGMAVLMTNQTSHKKFETEMVEMVDLLQKKNRELRQFSYTISHDLRSPIARILGLVSLAEKEPEFIINNRTIYENIVNEINNLDNVLKEMNAVVSVRDEEKQKEFVTFESELKLIMRLLESDMLKSNALLIHDFTGLEGIVTIKSFLYSIMYNLVSNAIKYRRDGVQLKIELKSHLADGFVCLSVEDNGKGIDLITNRDKIFGLFNRFHGDKIEGKGVGLNLVKFQVESLGGNVQVESEINKGSIFKVYFPVNKLTDEGS